MGAFVPLHKSGKLRILGLSGDKRSPLVPEVPTLIEQGLTGMDARVWFGLFVPAGTPRDAIERVHKQIRHVFSNPAFVEKNLVAQAFEPIASSPEEFARFLKTDREAGAELIRISGARLN
jgi:tripartite-type tricarboxylate transporter receptor subunit TctC